MVDALREAQEERGQGAVVQGSEGKRCGPPHVSLVRRVFSWVEPAKKEIECRLKGGPPGSDPSVSPPLSLSSTNTIDL